VNPNLEEIISGRVKELERLLSERLHVTEKALEEILSGRLIVGRVLFRRKVDKHSSRVYIRILRQMKRAAILAMAILLLVSFTVNGFADGVRERFLTVILGRQSIQVQTIEYTNDQELKEAVLPGKLPEGYRYRSFTKSSGAGMLYVEYTNAAGCYIRYYYYPAGIIASYDAEKTEMREIRHRGEVIRIGQDETGKMVALFPFDERGNIQIEFDEPLTDQTILAVIDSIHPIN
jgi:hypothetical protein